MTTPSTEMTKGYTDTLFSFQILLLILLLFSNSSSSSSSSSSSMYSLSAASHLKR